MGWTILGILCIVALVCCAVGFYKYVYFLSIGYGFAVAGISLALVVMILMGNVFPGNDPTVSAYVPSVVTWLELLLFVAYGARLSGFLLAREIKNANYRKTLKEATGESDEKKMPVFVKIAIWLMVGVLYVAQTSPAFFRLYNGEGASVCGYIGVAISVIGIVLEAIADKQKDIQKKAEPSKVAMKGLYKMVRCPNYFGEILFWTGVFVGGCDIYAGVGQWIMAAVAWVCIVFIMFNGAQRLEKRQMKRYGDEPEYNQYADHTPIIIPLLPIYHLNKKAK